MDEEKKEIVGGEGGGLTRGKKERKGETFFVNQFEKSKPASKAYARHAVYFRRPVIFSSAFRCPVSLAVRSLSVSTPVFQERKRRKGEEIKRRIKKER
mmetsp:Transcript_31966/g.63366  ORF Transcript_31966/g.63366 Transcript_31966/m.63366 type:complete len:98 (-) Transcript_31966:193-486(-)